MILNVFVYLALLLASLIIIFAGPWIHRMQATTLWAGKKIANEGDSPRGLQDAITPKIQDNLNIAHLSSYVVLLILGTLTLWYLGLLLFVGTTVIKIVIKKFYSNNINDYLRVIIHGMVNRMADYKKSGDELRADAAAEVLEELNDLYVEVREMNLPIPSFLEIKQMPLGRN